MKLAPSILTADWSILGEQIRAADQSGADYIHLDIMDGHFVPNITFGPLVVETVRAITSLPLDVHLMIEHPELYVVEFARAGATIITVQQEASTHLHRQIQQIKELGCRASVALNPATPLVTIEEVLGDLDQVLIMSVNPGFGGQKFIPFVMDKVRRAREMLDAAGASADLEVDGGLKSTNIAYVRDAGATVAVTGSAVFSRSRSVAESLRLLREALGE